MRFDRTRILPCLVSTPCSDRYGGLRDPRCADPAFAAANPNICGQGGNGNGDDGGDGDGDGSGTCADPNYRATHLGECGDDPRCADPVFAEANPTLCLNNPVLIIKPASAQCEVGQSVLFKTFLLINGIESEVEDGLSYSSLSTSVAVIGATSGNATGLSVGVTTISVTSGALTAQAQLEIVEAGSCGAKTNYFVLAVDTSKSSRGAFSSLTQNRLAMAKRIANGFVGSTNLLKDLIAVVGFDTATTFQPFTDDDAVARDAINRLASSNNRTSISAGLLRARDELNAIGAESGNRHVILITDGENNEGIDPLGIAQQLKDSGVVVWVVGLRASFKPFRLLDRIATGGFFVNAIPSNESSVVGWVNGLKSYICSGNCRPPGDEMVGTPALNFDDFINWEVYSGHVDLIGKNDNGLGAFNFLPGNGLFVDLCGSAASPDLGTLRTRDEFTFEDGKEYRLTVAIAGNQREGREGDEVYVAIGRFGAVMIAETVSVGAYEDFTDHVFTFTASAAEGTTGLARIIVGQQEIGPGSGVFGCLLGSVELRNVTDDLVMFSDNFDGDNPQYVEPCGYGLGYGTDYGCDTGCLESPIPAQAPDPSPLPDMESLVQPPTIYTSQKTCEVECETGTGTSSATAAAVSDVSQADADSRAMEQACINARAGLTCEGTVAAGTLINYNFSLNAESQMTGPAVVGESGDVWNTNFFDALVDSDGLRIGVTLGFGFPLPEGGFGNGTSPAFSSALMRSYVRDAETAYFLISELPAGTYELFLFGHGDADTKNTVFTVETGEFTTHAQEVGSSAVLVDEKATSGTSWNPGSLAEDREYVRIAGITVGAEGQIRITCQAGSDVIWYFNGFQLRRTA